MLRNTCGPCPQLVRRFRLEYHHKPLDYKVTFMYAPEGELRFKLVERSL